MLRYIRSLSDKDLALDRSMIPLGSCTMKLNATSEMIPITWPEFAQHPPVRAGRPAAPAMPQLERAAARLAVPGHRLRRRQPAAQRRLAGRVRRPAGDPRLARVARREPPQRLPDPESAHGTNPASAQMAGMQVVVVKCDAHGQRRPGRPARQVRAARANAGRDDDHLPVAPTACSRRRCKELCALVHEHGGRVYVDGANMNALVGVAAPGEFGGDVSHLNLHKTFCIPHGGGGPGVGPVCVVEDLVPFLPATAPRAAARASAGRRRRRRRRWATPRCCRSAGCTCA